MYTNFSMSSPKNITTYDSQDTLDGFWDAGSSGPNDGYFIMDYSLAFDSLIAFVPARAFAIAFGTWYASQGVNI